MSKKLIFIYLLALLVLHHDFWLKDNPSLVFGVFPASLAYHMLFTVLAALGWFLVVRFAWPEFDEEEDS